MTKVFESEIKILDKSYVKQIFDLQKIVLEGLEKEELYFPLSEEEIKEALGVNGLVVGAFDKDNLIGFTILTFPNYPEENVGRDVGLLEHELNKVLYINATNVHPNFRGMGMQKILTKYVLEKAKEYYNYRYICATASPYNYGSTFNLLSMGLKIVKIKYKYKNYLRYILFKDVNEENIKVKEDKVEIVPMEDIEKQMKLIDEKFYGYTYKKDKDGLKILFKKETNEK